MGLVRALPGAALTPPSGILRVPVPPSAPALGALESLLGTLEQALPRGGGGTPGLAGL